MIVSCLYVTGINLPVDNEASCWSKQTQRDQTYFTRPSISARMRRRRAFADKELENVMLETELRQRELQNELTYPAISPVVHPIPLPVSSNLDCCGINKDPPMSAYVSVYKYKPLYECDFQFYQFFHLKSCSSAECTDFYQSLEQPRQDESQNIFSINEKNDRAHPPLTSQEEHRGDTSSELEAVKPTLLDSSASSCSASGSDWVVIGEQDTGRTSELRSVRTWSTHSHMARAEDSEQSRRGGPVGSPTEKPLPFSVEALLKA